jgi:16S rRNA processing protein RimM
LVPLGEIVATHGLDGWVKLNPFNPETTALESAHEVLIERGGARSAHELDGSRPHQRQILIKLRGIDDVEAAKLLIGATLSVAEDSLPVLEPGQYYHFHAIGLEVFDTRGNRLGIISRLWPVANGEIYVVRGAGKEYLIPAVKDIIEKVDFDAGKMIINPPDGLLDL